MISSILIPVYNQHEAYLRAAILSALGQSVPVQVVVVDDGSDTPIRELVYGLYDSTDTKCELTFVRQANGGVAAALNAGLEVSTGDYIQWLSSDDLFRRDKTERQVAVLRQADTPVSYCAYEDGVPFPQATWPAVQYPDQATLFDLLKQHCFINACTVMWHRSVFDELGPFDTAMVHVQDLEMLLRCAERWNFAALNEPLVRRRTHPGQMLNTLRDPEQAELKRQDLAALQERYGATVNIWLPEGEQSNG